MYALYIVRCIISCNLESHHCFITPPFLVDTVNLYFLAYAKIKMRQILSKQFDLITLDFNNVKYPWRSPNTRRNRTMFESRSIYLKKFRTHSRALALRYFMLLWYSFVKHHGVDMDCEVSFAVDNGWGECIMYQLRLRFIHGMSASILVNFWIMLYPVL